MIFDATVERFRKIMYGYDFWGRQHHPVEIDPITLGLHVIASDHHEIHEGTAYTACFTRTTDATDGHRSGLYLKTPPSDLNPRRAHMVVSFAASTAAEFSILEAPTIAPNVGTHTGVIYNRFRDGSRISGCRNNATTPAFGLFTTLTEAQIAADGTWATGTILRKEPLRVGDGAKPAGGAGRGQEEYILKVDTAYVFLITNTTAAANTHFILADWYEHRTQDH